MPHTGGQPDVSRAWQDLYTGAGSTAPAPRVQPTDTFTAPSSASGVSSKVRESIMAALGDPSRYGSEEAGKTFDVLNSRLEQTGGAARKRIDEDMARRGIHASTTAGGYLGDLETNQGQQRANFATEIGLDQAKNYQSDRASAIAQAMGYGGQEFDQGLAGFEANQGAGAQRFNQENTAGRFRFDQDQQDYNQRTGAIEGLEKFGQQGFDNQMTTAGFNADQDYRNTDMWLRMLGQT